tara:strand:+ start:4832 stop:6307 length:1476 start_codon:yes stop_codon:yes gene_type:complete
MAAILEIKYFNSFILKNHEPAQVPAVRDGLKSAWNGSHGIPQQIGGFPLETNLNYDKSWYLEEARIRAGFNNTSTDYGVRAYLVEQEPNASIRFNSLIYSGIYNSRTGVNNTNVFSIADEITKSLDPANGSIQKLYAEDTNLIIFQQYKVNKALIDKDAIYSAEGGGLPVSSFKVVIGQTVPFPGNYGIGNNPESFAVYGYNKYFVDPNQNVVMRLGPQGLEEISRAGMNGFFRNQIVNINSSASGLGKLIGAWDIYNKEYVLSLQPSNSALELPEPTLSYDERAQGWISFYSYKPRQSFSIRNQHYTTNQGVLFLHNAQNDIYNTFYGVSTPSSIEFTFNPQVSNSKVFNTVNYEGSNGWQVDSFVSDETGPGNFSAIGGSSIDTTAKVLSYIQGAYDSSIPPLTGAAALTATATQPVFRSGFYRKENKYCANLINNSKITENEIAFGDQISGIKGFFANVKISTDTVTDPNGFKELFAVSSNYTFSSGY